MFKGLNPRKLGYYELLNIFRRQSIENSRCFLSSQATSVKNESDEKTEKKNFKTQLIKGPSLHEFINSSSLNNDLRKYSKRELKNISHPYLKPEDLNGNGRKVFFEIHGCPMNTSDAEVAWSILSSHGYERCNNRYDADVILIVTCSLRDNSEQKIWNKLKYLRSLKTQRAKKYPLKIGILGCMAERLKSSLIEDEKAIDLVAGPDSYRDLPRLLSICETGESSVNVLLSLEETYADIMPISLSKDNLRSYVSIMRGCDNMCSYCIVPFTRGKERSRSLKTILDEIKILSETGVKEVVLLGQNVNSYIDLSETSHFINNIKTKNSAGFKTIYKPKCGGLRFAELLDQVSLIDPEMRIRFTSPHPKDFPDEVLYLIKERNNICNNLHLPAQCGSTRVLEVMNRGYTREAYISLVRRYNLNVLFIKMPIVSHKINCFFNTIAIC